MKRRTLKKSLHRLVRLVKRWRKWHVDAHDWATNEVRRAEHIALCDGEQVQP